MNDLSIPLDIVKRKDKKKKTVIPKDYFFLDKEEIPEKIIVYLSEDIDLEQIDKTIRIKYSKLKNNLQRNEQYIKELQKELKEDTIESKKIDLKNKIEKEKKFIKDINEDLILKEYTNRTKEYLEGSRTLISIKKYLEIADKYIQIDVIKNIGNNYSCEGCGDSLEDLEENQEGFSVCPNCNCINNYIKPFKCIKDPEHYLLNTGDDDINNFIKILQKFEGKNVSNIPEDIYDRLDDYFLNKGMKLGIYYKNLPLTEEGKKEGTTKKKMWGALESLGFNQYYDEINHITHVYWGWRLPDLSLYRNQIIKDYQLTQQVWQRIKKDYNRSASLGTSFRLFSHLRAVNYPYCKKEDFKIQDMVESLRLHDDAWRRMCEETGVKYYSIY